jgi:translocator protein
MTTRTVRPLLNLLAVIVTIAINTLANVLPINGLNTGEISDRFQVYFVPAGYVFSIWGLIYLGLLAFAIYQVLPAQRDNPRLARIGWLFILSCVANCVWIILWHYLQFTLTGLVIVLLLASLIGIYVRLGIGHTRPSTAERWCVDAPFSLYLGWVSVATIANLTDVLNTWGVAGTGPAAAAWAIALLAIGVALAVAMAYLRRDVIYGGVVVWAFIGIALKQAATPSVALAAWAGAAVVAVALVVLSLPRQRAAQPA